MGDMFTVCTLTNLFGAFYPGVFAGTRGTSKSMNERHTSCTMLNGITLLAVAVGEAEGRGTGLESASVGALLPAFKDFIFEKTSSDKSIRGEKMIPLLSDALQHAYHAVDDMFKQPGCKDEASEYLPRCTLTAVLVDPEFGFAFLQLGDCFAMLIDAATGEIKWQTEQHDFTNSKECKRYLDAEAKLEFCPLEHTFPAEGRKSATVHCGEEGSYFFQEKTREAMWPSDSLPSELARLRLEPEIGFMPFDVGGNRQLALLLGTPGLMAGNPFCGRNTNIFGSRGITLLRLKEDHIGSIGLTSGHLGSAALLQRRMRVQRKPLIWHTRRSVGLACSTTTRTSR